MENDYEDDGKNRTNNQNNTSMSRIKNPATGNYEDDDTKEDDNKEEED